MGKFGNETKSKLTHIQYIQMLLHTHLHVDPFSQFVLKSKLLLAAKPH